MVFTTVVWDYQALPAVVLVEFTVTMWNVPGVGVRSTAAQSQLFSCCRDLTCGEVLHTVLRPKWGRNWGISSHVTCVVVWLSSYSQVTCSALFWSLNEDKIAMRHWHSLRRVDLSFFKEARRHLSCRFCNRHLPIMSFLIQGHTLLLDMSWSLDVFLTCSGRENKCLSQCLWTFCGSSPAAS